MASYKAPVEAIVSWEFTPEQIIDTTKEIIAKSNKLYDELELLEDPTIENLVLPSLQFENENDKLINQLTFLKDVSSDPKIREASNESAELLQNYAIETMLRSKLFAKLDQLMEKFNTKQLSKDDYDYEVYHFFEKNHQDFVRAGLKLSKENQLKIEEIQKKIGQLTLEYSKNLGEQQEFLLFTKEELEGVSDDVMNQFEKIDATGDEPIKYKVTFKYPDIIPVLKNAKNPETRKRAYVGDQNKVSKLNEPLFLETLKLRKELGEIMGFETYADYNLDIKMAKKKEAVFEFMNDLIVKLQPAAALEIENLKKLKRKDYEELNLIETHGKDLDTYYVWDHNYYNNKMLKEQYNVDTELISNYFPLETILTGMLETYEQLFNLKFVEEQEGSEYKQVWHEDVKQLGVWKTDNVENPEFIGWLYLDLHPRDGKYGHAANFGIASTFHDLVGPKKGDKNYSATALVCNFSKPQNGKPALLKHNEITTFFHECGHGIHHLCAGTSNVSRFNSPGSVEWDFVEAPSQMLEFFTWEIPHLKKLSKHYETGEQISDELLDSLIKTKHVNSALFYLRQLHFGTFDMKVHTEQDLENLNIVELWNDLRKKIAFVSSGDEITKGFNSFGHIMTSSYSAGYYGYLWAEVYAADIYHSKFSLAKNEQELNQVGKSYRDLVLGKSGVYGVTPSVTEFLGRPANNDAFLKELGVNN